VKFGYARVSTDKQILDRQIDALTAYGVDELYEEKISGSKRDRPQLDLLFSRLRTGDVLVIYELKRLGRNTKQLLALAEEFQTNGIELVSLTEQIDTTTPMGRFVFTTWCALAQLDRDIISENTKSGLSAARARGRVGGRRPIDKKIMEKALKMYWTGKFTIKEILETTGISKASLYLYVNRAKEENDGAK
jgi:DNA invertase Pin-like site-specific DNA recombinase